MLPFVPNVSNFTLPPPIVNTTVPGTATVHVPYDNVAPSVSSAQINNNARGNSNAAAPPPVAPPVTDTPDLPQVTPLPSVLTGAPPGVTLTAQATFIAQLAGQDTSPETQVILVQYEKMVTNSIVKYKPSFAFKPPDEPSSVFGRILLTEKQSTQAPQNIAQSIAKAQSAEIAAVNSVTATAPAPSARSAKTTSNVTETDNDVNSVAPAEAPAPYSAPPPPRAIAAYQVTASRLAIQLPADAATEIV